MNIPKNSGLYRENNVFLRKKQARKSEKFDDDLKNVILMRLTGIVCTARNYDIGIFFCWAAEFFECWLDKEHVLVQDLIKITATFVDISGNSEMNIG